MKKLIIAFMTGLVVLSASPGNAQVSVNVNLGAQPVWGPTGYNHVDYYYLPDIETYYYVPRRQFVYQNNGKWMFTSALPSRYSGYNLNNGYKVVLNTPRPYLSFKDHKVKYAKYKSYKGKQSIIRYSNDPKYFKTKGHPKYSPYPNGKPSQKNENENGGKGKGKKH